MNQTIIPLPLLLYSLVATVIGFYKSKNNQTHSLAHPFYPLGIFVFADALIIGPFWVITAFFFLVYPSLVLLGLVFSVFWAVRSFGETIYWLNQQFSPIKREPPQKFLLYKLVKNDSVWFLHQLIAQVTLVVSLISSVIFLNLYFNP